MKIYFAGSIRGGREDQVLYKNIIEYLKSKGVVLTEHVGEKNISILEEKKISDKFIHTRDMRWLLSCDFVVAEVSTPSLGVGYEIGRALENGKKILCLYRKNSNKRLSAMIGGCDKLKICRYANIKEVKKEIDSFLINK